MASCKKILPIVETTWPQDPHRAFKARVCTRGVKTDLSGFVVTIHSGLCEQYVKSLGLTASEFDFLLSAKWWPFCVGPSVLNKHCILKWSMGLDKSLTSKHPTVIILVWWWPGEVKWHYSRGIFLWFQIIRNVRALGTHGRAWLPHPCGFGEKVAQVKKVAQVIVSPFPAL